MDEEALTYWQDILDDVVNGREDGHVCPFCEVGDVVVERTQGKLKLRCMKCGKFIEGRM